MLNLRSIKIRSKFLFAFIVTGIIPLVIVGVLGSRLSTRALLEKSFEELTAVQDIRKNHVEKAFKDHFNTINLLAEAFNIPELMDDLTSVFPEMGDVRYREVSLPVNESAYRNVYDSYQGRMHELIRLYSYRDLFLITPEEGHIVFRLTRERDLGDNLKHGAYRYSGLEKLRQKIVSGKKISIVDFEPFEAGGGKEAAFIGMPFFKDQKMVGILALEIGPESISGIVKSREGLGNTGESYLLSWLEQENIFEFRSDMQTMGNGRYVVGYRHSANMPYWEDAAGNKEGGRALYADSVGTEVLVAYNSLDIAGLNWFLISKINKTEVIAPVRNLVKIILLIGGVLVLLIAVSAVIMSLTFTRPIIGCMTFAQEITGGNFSKKLMLRRGDELGRLGDVLNKMAFNLKKQDWMKAGKEGLDDEMRGEHDPAALAGRFISFIVKHLEAEMGAVYLLGENKHLNLVASHAFKDRSGNFNNIPLGEGIVGQVALERSMVLFSNVDDGPVLNYGVGEKIPSHFLIAPMVFDEKLIGVFLVGSVTHFKKSHEHFVGENLENVAILFNASKSRETIGMLFQESQAQQEELRATNEELAEQTKILKASEAELQAQQEELRITNEELEQQTQALQQSESELQAQQEELRVTNEELEERTRALEKQKDYIEARNGDLSKAQKEIEKRARELEVASKYKSEFLANMSHELRTPLNSILILSQLFAGNRDGNLTDKQVESAKAINSSGSDLLNLINEILDLSKVEAGKLELNVDSTRISGICSDLSRVFESVASEKGIRFSIQQGEGLPETILTDSHRLQQVLRNLLSNAFKFTDVSGNVSLTISRPTGELAGSAGLDPAKSLVFSVMDDGIGIPEDKHQTVFEAFQQADGGTSRKYGGTGLGLSISRELSKLLGGVLTLSSTPGKGSNFSVVLPEVLTPGAGQVEDGEGACGIVDAGFSARACEALPVKAVDKTPAGDGKEEKAPGQNPGAKNDAASGEKESFVMDDRKNLHPGDKTILFVEDDASFAGVLCDLAREQGFKTIVAEDGETGLHFADYYKPSAIILDIGLPGIDGWTVMERLKINPDLRHIPVHFMSGQERSLDAMRMGAIGFLTKPVSVEKMNGAFEKIEHSISGSVKKLLIVEDDRIQQESISQLVANDDIEITCADNVDEALSALAGETFDCLILDIGLRGEKNGMDLLENIRNSKYCASIPIIVYTGKDLTREEENLLQKYTKSVIIKGVRSPERLLDETALFLHRIEANMPRQNGDAARKKHDADAVLSGKRILLVDDDMRNVFSLSAILEEKDIDVLIARDGKEGVEMLQKNSDSVDLVLMDIMMPVMDGYQAMRSIRKEHKFKKLPIISLTAKAMKGDRNKCIEAGASDYLAKPVDTEKLLSMLRVWLF